jgi:hypothetical protein
MQVEHSERQKKQGKQINNSCGVSNLKKMENNRKY